MNAPAQLVLALVVAVVGVGCEVDYKAPLVGGYSIMRANSTTIWVVGPSEDASFSEQAWAGPVVVGVDVMGDIIAGHAITPLEDSAGEFPVLGYFVIDTASHERWLGLSKQEYDERCSLLGIKPILKSPRSFKQ